MASLHSRRCKAMPRLQDGHGLVELAIVADVEPLDGLAHRLPLLLGVLLGVGPVVHRGEAAREAGGQDRQSGGHDGIMKAASKDRGKRRARRPRWTAAAAAGGRAVGGKLVRPACVYVCMSYLLQEPVGSDGIGIGIGMPDRCVCMASGIDLDLSKAPPPPPHPSGTSRRLRRVQSRPRLIGWRSSLHGEDRLGRLRQWFRVYLASPRAWNQAHAWCQPLTRCQSRPILVDVEPDSPASLASPRVQQHRDDRQGGARNFNSTG